MAKKLAERIYIDGNLLIKEGVFYCKDIAFRADQANVNADITIEKDELQDGILEINEEYGSPYVQYYVGGEITFYQDPGIVCFEKITDNLLDRTIVQLNEVRRLLDVSISDDLCPLFYREQYAATISILENFLYCMVLREMVFDRAKLLNNIRTFDYKKDMLDMVDHIGKTDDDLYKEVVNKATSIIYHTFVEVEVLYKIIFRKDISPILKSIKPTMKKRHNIVHRNGQKLNGEVEPISKIEVENFINKVENITQNIWDLIKAE